MTEHPVAPEDRCDPPKRVLVVDDHVDTAFMMKVLLQTPGFEVTIAHNGQDALAAARARPPDVVLTDLTLPGISGVSLAETLQADDSFAETMILAVSGHDADRLPQPSPFDGHVMKPVDWDRLISLINRPVRTRARNATADVLLSTPISR
jgi:CheY-like chemotaxis protein